MSKLLLDEHPLVIIPSLAVKIGLNESIVLQQVNYWNEINRKANNNFKDGYYWTFNSYEDWTKQFPFWAKRTIQRIISSLENKGLLISANYNKMKIDRTKWYRIDYNVLENLEKSPSGQSGTTRTTTWHDENDNLTRPIPEINTKTKTKINSNGIAKDNSLYLKDSITFQDYLKIDDTNLTNESYELVKAYHLIYGEQTYSKKLFDTIVNNINESVEENYLDIDEESASDIVKAYKRCKFKQHSLLHLSQPNILIHRLQEIGVI